MNVFCFYLPGHASHDACSIVLDEFLHDSVAFCLSISLTSLFLTYELMVYGVMV